MRALTGSVLAACCAASALAQGAPPPPGRPGLALPATRTEAAALVRQRFDRLDVNRDGFLVAAEMPARGPVGTRSPIERLDRDGDGRLSPAEFEAGALRLFDLQDTDRDGTLSDAERAAWRERAMKARATGE